MRGDREPGFLLSGAYAEKSILSRSFHKGRWMIARIDEEAELGLANIKRIVEERV